MRLNRMSARLSVSEKRLYRLAMLALVFILLPPVNAVTVFLLHKGYVAQAKSGEEKLVQLGGDLLSAPLRYLRSDHAMPVVNLDVKYEDWARLEQDRALAMSAGGIVERRSEVAAMVSSGGEKFKAKLRLQGDMLDHIDSAKRWSLRLELKNKKALFSARRFALVSPHVRVHHGPLLFAKTLDIAGFDIVSPELKPVRVVVNGDDWGVMLFEQSFGQSLLAVNGRTEGLIVRLDLDKESRDVSGDITRTVKPRVIQKKTVLGNSALAMQRKIALELLVDFFSDRRSAGEVFDAAKLGQYLATVDIWGAWHALTWNNWRWYYNPHTAKLEPIQSDVAVTPARHIWLMQAPSNSLVISKKMLIDPRVKAHYQQALLHLNKLITANELVQKLDQYQKNTIRKFHASAPLTPTYNLDVLSLQASCVLNGYDRIPCQDIRPVGNDLHVNAAKVGVRASWDLVSEFVSDEVSSQLTLFNNEKTPLHIKDIVGKSSQGDEGLVVEKGLEFPRILRPGDRVLIRPETGINSVNVTLSLNNKKSESYTFDKNVKPDAFLPRPTDQITDLNNVLNKYPFISQSDGTWHIRPGEWKIDHYLVTPDNWRVIVDPGVKLSFSEKAGIMVFGELLVNGQEGSPVLFTKQHDSSRWSGFVVFGRQNNESHIHHLNLSYASSPKLGHWQPRGSAYLVNSRLSIRKFLIEDNVSEDALNIVSSEVDISALTIRNALSDAFDCDFCQGRIANSRFENIGFRSGGDGIDVSGSQLVLDNVFFYKVRDKAISAGEASRLQVVNASFKDVNFGIVAKDDSKVEAFYIQARRVKHKALMSYTKKPIFGPARLHVDYFDCLDTDCKRKLIAGLGSVLRVNGDTYREQKLDVKKLYQTVMKSDKPI